MSKKSKIYCKFCVDSPLRASKQRGVKDRILFIFGRAPMRCWSCDRRTYQRKGKALQKAES